MMRFIDLESSSEFKYSKGGISLIIALQRRNTGSCYINSPWNVSMKGVNVMRLSIFKDAHSARLILEISRYPNVRGDCTVKSKAPSIFSSWWNLRRERYTKLTLVEGSRHEEITTAGNGCEVGAHDVTQSQLTGICVAQKRYLIRRRIKIESACVAMHSASFNPNFI
jgi:hypothetical protein